MKHLIKSKRLKHHRPMPRLFLFVVGALFFSNLAFAPSASALDMGLRTNANKSFFAPLKDNEDKLKKLDEQFKLKQESLEDKAKQVEAVKQEASVAINAKEAMTKQIAELKEQLASLDDMFVRIASYAPDASGNAYALGNCTWYVKSKRPDIGNFWGNANSWYSSAAASGFKVGSKAKVGAIGTTQEGWAGHVVYVEKVSRDGSTVTISEMNYGALYQMNTRTVPASSFSYIYEKP